LGAQHDPLESIAFDDALQFVYDQLGEGDVVVALVLLAMLIVIVVRDAGRLLHTLALDVFSMGAPPGIGPYIRLAGLALRVFQRAAFDQIRSSIELRHLGLLQREYPSPRDLGSHNPILAHIVLPSSWNCPRIS